MTATTVFARVPFTYARKPLERGELVVLQGTPRDDQLRSLGYFLVYSVTEHKRVLCETCSKAFAGEGFLTAHKRKKGGCHGESAPITNAETAALLDLDPAKVKVED